jgi:hypothetical protein
MHALRRAALAFAAIGALVLCGIASAQDVHLGVTYVCNGDSLLVESCNMRDTSDTSTCLVQHPDRPQHNGFVAYTNETRGTLKKLLPTCTQPGAAQVARADSARKGAQDKQDAILQQNLKLMDTPPPAPGSGGTVGSAKSQRDKLRLTRCLSAGRTEMQCAGNEFGKAFEGVFAFANTLIGGAVKQPDPGLYMLGTYEGKGGWYIEFSQDIAQMACSDLVNESQDYTIKFDGAKTVVRVENKPAPLVFTLREGKLYGGSEPVQVAGAIVVGHTAGSGGGSYDSGASNATINTSTQTTSRDVNPMEAQAYQRGGGSGTITQSGAVDTITETSTTTTYSHPSAPAPSYNTGPQIVTAPRTRTCVAPVLANLHPPQSQDVGSAMTGLAGVFGMGDGDANAKKSAALPTPAGLRMQGEFAVPGGAGIDFHSDAAVVACGTVAALYPYAVDSSGGEPVLRLAANGKPPIDLKFGPEQKTLIGSGTLQVSGRVPSGADQYGNVAYTQRTVSCALGKFSPVTDDTPITATQPVAANPSNSTANASSTAAYPAFSTPTKPTGTAILNVASGFPAQAGVANPLGGQAYILLRDPVASVLAKSGAALPAKISPQEAVHAACETQKPECKTYLVAISKDAATGLKADAAGKATLPGVPVGTYYLTASAKIGALVMYWNLKIDLKAGTNSVTLDTQNAIPVK